MTAFRTHRGHAFWHGCAAGAGLALALVAVTLAVAPVLVWRPGSSAHQPAARTSIALELARRPADSLQAAPAGSPARAPGSSVQEAAGHRKPGGGTWEPDPPPDQLLCGGPGAMPEPEEALRRAEQDIDATLEAAFAPYAGGFGLEEVEATADALEVHGPMGHVRFWFEVSWQNNLQSTGMGDGVAWQRLGRGPGMGGRWCAVRSVRPQHVPRACCPARLGLACRRCATARSRSRAGPATSAPRPGARCAAARCSSWWMRSSAAWHLASCASQRACPSCSTLRTAATAPER